MSLDPLTAAFDLGSRILDKVFPDPAQRDAAKIQLLQMQQNGELAQLTAETDLAKGQLAVDQIEASSGNLFVSGWRPFIGWICGCAFGYHFILQPLLAFGFAAAGHTVILPVFDMSNIFEILLGMLGLGGLRTFEKFKGVA